MSSRQVSSRMSGRTSSMAAVAGSWPFWVSCGRLRTLSRARRPRRPAPGRAPTCRGRRTGSRTCTACGPTARSRRSSVLTLWRARRSSPTKRLKQFQKQARENRNQDRRDGAGTNADVSRAYNDFWWDFGRNVSGRQTSLVIDPPDGRIPALTPEAQQRAAALAEVRSRRTTAADGPEDRSLWERCITRQLPTLPGPYNNNIQIVQTRDHVVIVNEMIHEARDHPARRASAGTLTRWHGDSRGRWEGDTLVVETREVHQQDELSEVRARACGWSNAISASTRARCSTRSRIERSGDVDAAVDGADSDDRRTTRGCSSTRATRAITACRASSRVRGSTTSWRLKPPRRVHVRKRRAMTGRVIMFNA